METKKRDKKKVAPSANGTEQMYTMAGAVEELKSKDEARRADEQKRLQKFVQGLNALQQETGCTLQIDSTSPLNDIKIIPVPSRA